MKRSPWAAWTLGLFMVFAGITQFTHADDYRMMVPPPLPPSLTVVCSGLAEIGVGLAVWVPTTRRWGGWAVFALLIAVLPANLYMAVAQVEAFGATSDLGRWARLPLQLPLLYWALHVARSANRSTPT
jgi:uncharacterized membrane protein